MLALVVCAVLWSTSHIESTLTSDYKYHTKAQGWLKLHKVATTWPQAFLQCHNEGSVLASPLTEKLREVMQNIIDDNDNSLAYFIGANSRLSPGYYMSIEGVPLENTPTADMYRLLDTELGQCLSTDGRNISVVSCTIRLPYLCYNKKDGRQLTECGTFDKEYKYVNETGSCYKVHREMRTWLEASSLCISEGGHLAIIDNEEEARIVTAMIPDIRVPWIAATKEWETMYIGLQDWTGTSGDGTWLTSHGQRLEEVFNAWSEGQPDRVGDANCGAINRQGLYDNIWCHNRVSYFICEKEPKRIRYPKFYIAINKYLPNK